MSAKKVLVLFDVDDTLTVPRKQVTPEVKDFLLKLRTKVAVGIVGGSDLVKQKEQLGNNIIGEVDYSFSENGLVAYKNGELIGKEVTLYFENMSFAMASDLQCLASYLQAIHTFLGEDNVKAIVNFALRYIADLDIPIKRYGFASVSICLHFIPAYT